MSISRAQAVCLRAHNPGRCRGYVTPPRGGVGGACSQRVLSSPAAGRISTILSLPSGAWLLSQPIWVLPQVGIGQEEMAVHYPSCPVPWVRTCASLCLDSNRPLSWPEKPVSQQSFHIPSGRKALVASSLGGWKATPYRLLTNTAGKRSKSSSPLGKPFPRECF